MNIDKEIIELLEDLNQFYKDDNWLTVKKFLVRYLNPILRKKFTTRNFKTKKHTLNLFEKEIITYYYKSFNIQLRLYDEDLHKEEEIS
jgi:hypothetical protein